MQAAATSTAAAHRLLAIREARLVASLQRAMAAAPAAVFDTWMLRESDLVQATAEAFVTGHVAAASAAAAAAAPAALRGVLAPLLRLDALVRVEQHLEWYLLEGLVAPAAAKQVRLFCAFAAQHRSRQLQC